MASFRAAGAGALMRWVGGATVLILLIVVPVSAQKPRAEVFTVDHGLPSSAIIDLAQDASGRLWIVTRRGLAVYDGETFRVHSSVDGLPSGELRAVEIDASGRVWTVTQSQPVVSFWQGSTWRHLPPPPAVDGVENVATSLASVGAPGQMTVALGTADSGLLIWNGDVWSRFDERLGLPSNRALTLSVLGDQIAVGTSAGLCLFAAGQLDCAARDLDPRLRGEIHASFSAPAASRERLWLLGKSWLGFLEGGVFTVVTEGFEMDIFDAAIPAAIVEDQAGGVYFGSSAVAFFLAPEESRARFLGLREGMAGEGTTALWSDRESNVWVGSLRGLTKISSRHFVTFDVDSGLLEKEVTAIVELEPGRYLLGHNTGLTFFDGEHAETVPFDRPGSSLYSQRVLKILVAADGAVRVVAKDMGLLRLTSRRTWDVELKADNIFTAEIDAEGTLWVANETDLYRRDGSDFVSADLGAAGRDLENLRWLQLGGDGRLYLSARGGLLWREADGWQVARGPTVGSNNVYGVFAEATGPVWVGTAAGLYQLRGEEIVEVEQKELAIDHPVYLFVKDPSGRLWIGTNDGVYVWDGVEARQFTVRDGLAGHETNRGAGLVDRQGRVWIGTDQGLSLHREAYVPTPLPAPGVELKALEIDGQLQPLDEELALGFRQGALTFHFGAVSMSREGGLLYRHRLEGFDEDWQGPFPLTLPEVRYTNMPPGSYRFLAAVGRPDGSWSEDAVSALIVIAPPYWQRPWFYLLALATLALLIFGAHGLRTRVIRARNVELEILTRQLNQHITERESLINDLEAKNAELERFTYTVSHDLKSPLVTIKGFLGLLKRDVATGDEDRVRHDLERIGVAAGTMGQLLDELLELSRIGRVANEPEAFSLGDLVVEAVDLNAGRLADRSVDIEISPDLPVVVADRVRILEVFQNLVENAIKFAGDQPQPRIVVGMRAETPPVFYVADNGIGVDPKYQELIFGLFDRLDQQIEGTGVGLTLVRRIVEIHGGRIWVESAGEGEGATFCFTLPGKQPSLRSPARG